MLRVALTDNTIASKKTIQSIYTRPVESFLGPLCLVVSILISKMGDASVPMDIPKNGYAAVVVNEGPDFHVEVVEVPVPEPGPSEVLIRLNATGLCMSDVHYMLNDIGAPPLASFGVSSPGHEGAGVIVKVGSDVKSLKVGQRAGYKPTWDVCHSCDSCRRGREQYCKQAVPTGMAKPGLSIFEARHGAVLKGKMLTVEK